MHLCGTNLIEVVEVRLVLDGEAFVRRNYVMRLDDEQAGVDDVDRVPYPIIVAVNVE